MKSTAEWTIDVLMLVAQTIFTLTGICYVWSMWKMRKRFIMSLRTQREVMVPLDFLGAIFLLISTTSLGPKLRKVHDICRLSLDAQKAIVLMIWETVVLLIVYGVPMPKNAFKYSYILAINIAYQPVVFAVVMKPVRDALRNDQHPSEADRVFLLPPWSWLRARIIDNIGNRKFTTLRVACAPELKRGNTVKSGLATGLGGASSHIQGTALTTIMSFPPLKEAFGEYCTRALCSESFQFLVDASEYRDGVHAVHHGSAESKDDLDFGTFTTITEEYIKDGSNSEININSSSKQKVMAFCDRAKYVALDRDQRPGVFLVAEN